MSARTAAWHAENRGTEKYEEWRKNVGEGGKGKHANFTMKGKHHSPETIEKIRASNKGKQKFSPEARAKMSAERKGRKLSPESIAKRSAAIRGTHRSPETKEKLSKMFKGRVISDDARKKTSETLKGRVIPPEARINMGLAQKGKKRTPEVRARLSAIKTGTHHTPETKAKLSAINKAKYEALSPEEQIALVEKMVKSGKNRNTSLEICVAHLLDQWGISYVQQERIGRYYPDFFLPDYNIILEAAGCFWHGCEQCGYNDEAHAEKIAHDVKRTAYFVSKGYMVITLWQHELEPFMKASKNSVDAV
jgi:G:T-mismatch repair DNA endonuclease (very short patch repair protein)